MMRRRVFPLSTRASNFLLAAIAVVAIVVGLLLANHLG